MATKYLKHTGTVKWFNRDRGFGFLVGSEDGTEMFVHRKNVSSSSPLCAGDKVVFAIKQTSKGPEATRVAVSHGRPKPGPCRAEGRAAQRTPTLQQSSVTFTDCVRAATVLAAEGLGQLSYLVPAILEANGFAPVRLPQQLRPPRRPKPGGKKTAPPPSLPPPLGPPRLTPRPLLLLPKPLNRRNCTTVPSCSGMPPAATPVEEPGMELEGGSDSWEWRSPNEEVDMSEFEGPQLTSTPAATASPPLDTAPPDSPPPVRRKVKARRTPAAASPPNAAKFGKKTPPKTAVPEPETPPTIKAKKTFILPTSQPSNATRDNKKTRSSPWTRPPFVPTLPSDTGTRRPLPYVKKKGKPSH